jgi:hypothetical protein
MAKVINPLLSGSASGQLGGMMTFDKRGYVRQYVVPSNPQTVNQMTVRNTMGDLQRALKNLGATLRGELRTAFGYRWNSVIIGELMANGSAQLDNYLGVFMGFTNQQKTDWNTADTSTPVLLDAGFPLFACASAVVAIAQRLGAVISLTQPAAGNSATVGAEWIA